MKTKSGTSTESWIDYLEGELDPSLREDYNKLLLNSKKEEKELSDLKQLRESILRADTYKYTDFNQKLFDKIVSDIEQTAILPKWRLSITSSKVWARVAASVVLVVGFLGFFKTINTNNSESVVESRSDKSDWIVAEAIQNPEVLALTINSHKAGEDLAFETLAYRAEDMSDDELEQIMDEILE